MKLKLEELKDGMWCRLASGEVYTFTGRGYWKEYNQALIDMGAEWYPKIPEGYRLATGEDKLRGTPCLTGAWWFSERLEKWAPCIDRWWCDDCEYIVPEKQEPKVYTVETVCGFGHKWLMIDNDFRPGDRVEVRKVSSGVDG